MIKTLGAKPNKTTSAVLLIIAVVILLLPFHAFLTVWFASNFGHYTAARLWKEGLISIAGLIVIYWLFSDKKILKAIFKEKLTWLIFAYLALDLITALVVFLRHSVSGKAMAYGLLDDLRFLAMFIICWAAALKSKRLSQYWQQLILWPAVIVVLFGLLQMSVLPKDVLAHFGYWKKTIVPFETINGNMHFIRIISTLRGADPLGAYLILPISALAVIILDYLKKRVVKWWSIIFILGAFIVLFGSFSRAAWIGAVLSILCILYALIPPLWFKKHLKTLTIGGISLAVVLIAGFTLMLSNTSFQNIILHTQTGSKAPISSNAAHLKALKKGLKTIFKQPLGQGPGTSGPPSVYNHYAKPRIAEDYFLTIGEESGWLGMLLFICINVVLGWLLWQRRSSPFALTLFASLVGLTFVNLLSIGWSDDTICYIWWGLAGLFIGSNEVQLKSKG